MPLLKPPRGTQLNKSHPLARGLVGCWLMNESGGNKVFDLSGNKNHGTFAASTTLLWKPCKFGSGLYSTGSGGTNYLTLTKVTELTKFTVAGWLKFSRFVIKNYFLYNAATYKAICFTIDTADTTKLMLRIGTGAAYTNFSYVHGMTIGKWHFVVGFYDGAKAGIYVDGKLIGSTASVITPDNSGLQQIGSSVAGNDSIQGYHDNWMFWNRALSAAEIQQLYREPFAMFERVSVGKLLYTLPVEVWLVGSAEAQSATSAALKQLCCIVGSAAAQSQGSALCKITRKVSATAASTAYLSGILTLSTRLPWFAGSLETERLWLREVLFNCVSANAFKLGTVLTGGWFWVRVSGCSALYRGAGMEQIDLTNILAIAAQDAREICPPSYLLHNSNSTYFYVVRRFNNCGYRECTLSAAVEVSIDAGGELAKPQSNNIFCSKTEQTDGDRIRLVWFYCPLEQKSKPARFKIYWDGRTGQIDYDNPVATINYQGRKYYNYETGALEAGRYLFAIRAEDAYGVENNSLARSRIDMHTTAPDPITILSAESI